MIKAVDLNKTYYQGKTKIEAVKSTSLEISRRETVLIAGASGAGKSTLLHLLGGLDRPTAGTVLIDGIDFYGLPDKTHSSLRNEKIGFVFQFYHLLPEFTALENVMLPAFMRNRKSRKSVKEARSKAENLLKLVGLEDRIGHLPSELSGGELQRAAIARALVNSPEVLLCDEPTGNLDSKKGTEIMNCLWTLKETEGMALVIVTHDEFAHDGFDKKFRMKDGTIEVLTHGAQGLPERQICR